VRNDAVKPRGFGFVEYEDASDAADAIENMDGTS
jgi:RNA recognition motif-containing protein